MFETTEIDQSYWMALKQRVRWWHFAVVGLVAIITTIGIVIYQRNEKYYDEVKTNLVRGNRTTRIFHIPHCPNYDTIARNNRIDFQTIAEAEKNGFEAAQNCPNNIIAVRRNFEAE